MGDFQDHFSRQAAGYAAHRPGYPKEMFAYLCSLGRGAAVAWDCATGSGQAARALAKHVDRVFATDASARQIQNAVAHPRVEYCVAPAERSGLYDHSVDLVAIAQAMHWFDLDQFHAEVRRVVRPGGVVAARCYALFTVTEAVDAVIGRLYSGILEPYWPAGRQHVDNGYADLPFPFRRVRPPAFAMEASWDLAQVVGMLETWSAVVRHDEHHRRGALELVRTDLAAAWGDPGQRRRVRWPLHLHVGMV